MALGDSNYIPLDPTLFTDKSELSELRKYILRKMGWPLIRVEITEEQLIDAIIDAVQYYQEYMAIDYTARAINTINGNVANIPDDINPDCIVDVIYERDYYDTFTAGLGSMGFEEALGGVLPFNLSGRSSLINDFDISGYLMYMQHMEDFKKVIGLRDHFEIVGNQIHCFPANKNYSQIGILYKATLSEKRIEQIPWIKQYALAMANITVGTIRSKLGGFSSTGTNIAVDGADLINRGITKQDHLEELILSMGMPMPFIQG